MCTQFLRLRIRMVPVGGFTAICTVGIFLLIIFPVFIWKCKTYDFMYKDLTNGRYQVIRTVIKQKVIVRTTHQANRHIYFCCHGVDEHVFPLSMDLVPAAEKGVPITVVKFPSYILPQGIVMSEDFDRKINEWEQKK